MRPNPFARAALAVTVGGVGSHLFLRGCYTAGLMLAFGLSVIGLVAEFVLIYREYKDPLK